MLARFLVHLLLTGKVFMQVSTEISAVGESVILPCLQQDLDTNVFWRHKGSAKVINIMKGKEVTEGQSEIFKDRIQTFPSEYSKGNYSIKLSDVEYAHEGTYSCFIVESNTEKKIDLVVNEKTVRPTKTATMEKSPQAPFSEENSSAEGQPPKVLMLQITVLGLALLLM
ncbi:hypothetical protein DNTS_012175 [Danionella cerebrum]|uniref:Ig-like domain-containing protein n=1 Tax=Danionella cerebrum TaxID=2873325 RepID=A0A553QUZ5_9TELE|nr:hypothetical protein DNTS_012175 [Danionella translucida]